MGSSQLAEPRSIVHMQKGSCRDALKMSLPHRPDLSVIDPLSHGELMIDVKGIMQCFIVQQQGYDQAGSESERRDTLQVRLKAVS